MRWVDVSIPMQPGMTVWPGDPPFALEPDARIAAGDSCNTSKLALSTHTGTHCDAPWHFIEDGPRLEDVDSGLFFGEAELRTIAHAVTIHADDLGPSPLPPRLLLRTAASDRPAGAPFDRNFAALEPGAAQRAVDEGVRLIGIDAPSIAPFGNSGPTHRILLGSGVFVIEGLRLASLPPGPCAFVVLPLPLIGADGAPCRAFAGINGK